MTSALSIVILIVSCVFINIVSCQNEKRFEGHFAQRPEYLSKLTKEERKEFAGIYRDDKLSIAEKEQKRMEFAEKHGFADVIKKENEKKVESHAKIIAERPKILKYLGEANEELTKIQDNKEMTEEKKQEIMNEFEKKYPHAASILNFISRMITGHKHHRSGLKPNQNMVISK